MPFMSILRCKDQTRSFKKRVLAFTSTITLFLQLLFNIVVAFTICVTAFCILILFFFFPSQPPVGQDRVSELGKWEDRKFKVTGKSWDVNSIDIAVAGLGWFSLGLKGEATVTLWAYDGIEVTVREPLVLDRAPFLERPGFWLPKAISDAIGNQNKLEAQKRKKLEENEEALSDLPV